MDTLTEARKIGLIIIGDEILSGKRQDKHLTQTNALLKPRGLLVDWVWMIRDDETSLVEAFRYSFSRNHIVFSFGGIGATADDKTRQCVAKALGVDLTLHQGAAEEIINKFGDKAYPQRITMAEFPAGSEMIPNAYNRVAGFSIHEHYFMPGFPIMAKGMLDWILNRYYNDLSRPISVEKSILITDGHEGEWIDFMAEFEKTNPDCRIFSLPTVTENDGRNVEIGVEGLEPEVSEHFIKIIEKAKSLQANFKVVD